ncbi:hypothetical protein B7P43_G13064 [Cryptotermes secundus]|uniref:Odorant receptor n=1 Tax=Cryptotermes secundus TaxID=105785 RepID=A0A2J7QMA4_9NEOP|nr:hypothetical protein B7P43_G13064 [Cryptotermes secundus]
MAEGSVKDSLMKDFLKVNIKTLKLVGLWNSFGLERKTNGAYTVFSRFVSTVIFIHVVTQVTDLFYTWGDLENFSATASTFLTYGAALIKQLCYLKNSKRIYRMVYRLRDEKLSPPSTWSEEQKNIANDYDRHARTMSWSYYSLGIGCLLGFAMTAIVSTSTETTDEANSTTTSRKLPYRAVFPFDTEKVEYYGIAFSFQMFIEELENVFNPMMFAQFLSSSGTLCLIIFRITVMDDMGFGMATFVQFLAISIMQLLLYCWYGNELTYQCESVVRSAYESPWYEASEGFKRSIRIMVVRSMKPFRLTGGKLYVMSLDTFVATWRRMEKMSWTDYVRNEKVLIRVSEQRNVLHEIRKRKANWIGHVLRRNCLLKEAIEGKIEGRIEVTRRRGRRRKKMLDDLGDRRGYCHLKEKALDRIKWRNCFERDCGPVVLTDY